MKVALMVAEKPSLAQSLANILSNSTITSRKGLNGACSVHEWVGDFQGASTKFKMTSVCGHVMSLDFVGKYNNWDKVDPVELFSCPTEKKEANPKLKMYQFLSQEGKGVDYLILWLDCDKEGENICYEVINFVQPEMRNQSPNNIYRARFSAITKQDIRAAMDNLGRPNYNEARSVDARQELDLRIGCAFTRFQTKYFQGKYGNLDSSLISYGPCQTPTLGFCVQRHDEIQRFSPETYWSIQITIDKEGKHFPLKWQRVRCFERDIAAAVLQNIKKGTTAEVIDISTAPKTKSRPLALNTVELMKYGSSGLNMGPHHVMQIAETLYTQGFISYPRTETTQYSDNFDLKGALRQLQGISDYEDEVRNLLDRGIVNPKKGHDVGDHPPITPMRKATSRDLEHEAWKIYDYVCRHFIASLSKDCKYSVTTIKVEIEGEYFFTSGKTVIDPGYTVTMPWQSISKSEELPDITRGETVEVVDSRLTESQTSPPGYLTESELITLMEKHGIGTDASIPVHINNISQRNYVTLAAGRKLTPTPLGIVLVHGYQKIDPELVLPTMRSAVEKQLNLIAHGKANFDAVLQHTVEVFKRKFVYFVSNIECMDELFEVSFSPLSKVGKPMSRCGKCKRYMKHTQTKPARLHCTHCDETYNLPPNGHIKPFKELRCPLDEFQLLSWATGSLGKSYTFCPYCYNHPPFGNMKKGSGCNNCAHPHCSFSMNTNGVSACLECETGVLVIDPSSGPKWKMGCNRCDVIIHLFEEATKISVEEEPCDCGAQMITVEYKQDRSKFADESLSKTACLYCCPEFRSLVEKHRAIASRPAANRPSRNRGRNRAKGANRQPKDRMAQLAAYFV